MKKFKWISVIAVFLAASLILSSCEDVNTPKVNAATPVITQGPATDTYLKGTEVTLTVEADVSDGGTLSYQWYEAESNEAEGGTKISANGTGKNFEPTTATAGKFYYYVVVTNTNNKVNGNKKASATSEVATITITDVPAPTISANPVASAEYAQDATAVPLRVTATVPAEGEISYQWYFNSENNTTGGTAIYQETNETFTPPTTSPGVTYYYVIVTNTQNGHKAERPSTVFTITVFPTLTGITVAPSTLPLTVGGANGTLTVSPVPPNAILPAISWTSSAELTAYVSAGGVVTAVTAGSATITAAAAGTEFTDTCAVTVSAGTAANPIVFIGGVMADLGSSHTAPQSFSGNPTAIGNVLLTAVQAANAAVTAVPGATGATVKVQKITVPNTSGTTIPVAAAGTWTNATASLAASAFTGKDYVQVQYTPASGPVRYYSIYIRRVVEIPYVSAGTISITDSDSTTATINEEDEWANAPELVMDRPYMPDSGSLTSVSDYVQANPNTHPKMKLLWSNDGLYFLLKVKDANRAYGSEHNSDNIELFISEDYTFGATGVWNSSGGQCRVGRDATLSAEGSGRITRMLNDTDAEYTIKGKIAWADPSTPVDGKMIGFDAQQAYAQVAGTRQACIMWNNFLSGSYNQKANTGIAYLRATVPTVGSIEVLSQPTKTSYVVGDSLDTAGMVVMATYSDGTTKTISNGSVGISPATFTTAGQAIAVTVSYGGQSDSFTVTVAEPTLTSIAVTTQPTKKIYMKGESLDTDGMVVTATYSNGTTAPVNNASVTVSPATFDTAGAAIAVTISYDGKDAPTFNVTVIEITGIEVTSPPTKTVYRTNDSLETAGIVVNAVYSDNSRTLITSGLSFDPTTFTAEGIISVTVSYQTWTTTFDVIVGEPQNATFNISYQRVTEAAPDISMILPNVSISGYTLSKYGTEGSYDSNGLIRSKTFTFTVDEGVFNSVKWFVDNELKGTDESYIVSADDFTTLGTKSIRLEVISAADGKKYSRTITFKVSL